MRDALLKPLVYPVARPYIAGATNAQALAVVADLVAQGYRATLDVLGESVTTAQEADAARDEYLLLLRALEARKLNRDVNISVKLSQMGLLFDADACEARVDSLVKEALTRRNFVRVEMEDSTTTDATLALYRRVRQQYGSAVGVVIQARLRRTAADLRQLLREGAAHIRLCKGIYREPRALAYTRPDLITRNYVELLEQALSDPHAFVAIATHDEALVLEAESLLRRHHVPRSRYEFQMLWGVDPQLRRLIHQAGHPLRVYVPYGEAWLAYCLRRLRENPRIAQHVLKNLFTGRVGS